MDVEEVSACFICKYVSTRIGKLTCVLQRGYSRGELYGVGNLKCQVRKHRGETCKLSKHALSSIVWHAVLVGFRVFRVCLQGLSKHALSNQLRHAVLVQLEHAVLIQMRHAVGPSRYLVIIGWNACEWIVLTTQPLALDAI